MEEGKEEKMSNNNTSNAMTGILLFFAIVICMWIYSIVKPFLLEATTPRVPVQTQEIVAEEPKKIDDSIFSIYESLDSNLTIKHYADGVIFEDDGKYKIEVLDNDMGYIITAINSKGIELSEPYRFIGQGWFTLYTAPIEENAIKEEIADTELQ